jgi:hypothetical protein
MVPEADFCAAQTAAKDSSAIPQTKLLLNLQFTPSIVNEDVNDHWFATHNSPDSLRHGREIVQGGGRLARLYAVACAAETGCPQCAHLRASMGISLRHSPHFLVVGSAGAGDFRMRATSMFTGVTTKK